jgi:hypothetical protein
MKNLLKFIGVIIGISIWIELVDFSFYLMNLSDTLWFYVGFLLITLITAGPIFYFNENIIMFLKNMKGVFTYKDEEEKKEEK